MNILFGVVLCVASLIAKPAASQTTYRLVDVPQSVITELPSIKETINAALKSATTDKDAFTIVNGKLRGYKNLPLRLRKQTGDGHFQYMLYYISAPAVAQTRIVDIKATKDMIDENIYRQHQFASALTDTVAAIDTLRLHIFATDFNWKITDYILRFSYNKETYDSELSSEGTNILLLCSEDLPEKGKAFACTLRHKGTGTEVASFWLHFLDETAQTELSSVAASLNENEITVAAKVRHLQMYAHEYWGNMQADNIRHWLLKQNTK